MQPVTLPALAVQQAAEPSAPVTPLALRAPAVQTHHAGEVLPPAPKRPRVTIEKTVEAYLADAVGRNVSEATLEKITTIFEKQVLPWTVAQGYGVATLQFTLAAGAECDTVPDGCQSEANFIDPSPSLGQARLMPTAILFP